MNEIHEKTHEGAILSESRRRDRDLGEAEALAADLAATQWLQEASIQLIRDGDVEALYTHLLDAAGAIMGSDYASIQKFYPEHGPGGALRLLGHRGFTPEAARSWEWVGVTSKSSCGAARRAGQRVIVADVLVCDFMAGSDDLTAYLQAGIHAAQSTPLVSRAGKLLGMLSTHWSQPHQPSERDLRLLDVLARQAADLIERAEAEEALRESEERFRAIVNQAVVGVAQTDLTGRFVLVNDCYCRMVGRSREALLNLRMQDITHPDDLPGNLEAFRRLVGGGPDFIIEKRYVRPDGTPLWVQNHVSLIHDAQGRPQYAAAVSEDITERKRQAVEIADLNARLQRAIPESHHRIKNNLQVLSSLIDIHVIGAEETVPISAMRRLGQHVRALAALHDLLTLDSKVGEGIADMVSARAALAKLAEMLQTAAGERRIVVRQADDAHLPVKQGSALTLLVNEIAQNAIKHGQGDIEITFALAEVWPPDRERRKAQRARLEVCDNGPGFPAGFDPQKSANTGLELIESMARWDLRGRTAYANRPEGGARVAVTFPLPKAKR